ncbi:MAG: NADH-quinone oxidoreductase subunit M [Legionellales bacterium]|nr:NADH-quinone oxidoreductase subunit M [Legionellales bacterium]|tara:strand:+ start:18117 stop:19637 length:1521 start_codon:yes stop_codon:yes gene_type:complete
MLFHVPILSLLIWIPILGGFGALLAGRDDNAHRARIVAVVTSLICMALCVPLYLNFDSNTFAMQFVENVPWITEYNIRYYLGVDGISMPMVILTTFTSMIVVLAALRAIKTNVSQYMAAFLVMQGLMIGVFAALDSVLFYVFWEGMLIPMYLCIGVWGGPNRTYASIKFFLYTFLGSVLMLVALLYLHNLSGSFAILDYYPLKLNITQQVLIFFAFFMAFAVKIPMWPVHTWLPDAHTEAPAGGSVVLAALMLKMGVYGFLRFSMPITPDASQALDWLMIGLSLFAIVYIGLVAIGQTDMKRLIAYSSIAHMGFATLGCYMVYKIVETTGNMQDAYMSLEGSMVQMISHAFSTGALFFGIGVLYDRMHTRMIKDYGGVANKMPMFAAFTMLFAMANVGLPGTSGFVGEFMILLSSFRASFWITFFAATTLILSAAYTLWMFKRVFFGEVANDNVAKLKEIEGTEILVLSILAFTVLFLGVYPEPLLQVLHASVGHLLTISHQTKLV